MPKQIAEMLIKKKRFFHFFWKNVLTDCLFIALNAPKRALLVTAKRQITVP
jgi:hypothetical protein